MPSPFREIAKLAALTIMRLSEVRLPRREHVHLELGVLLLPKTKTGPGQVILSEAAQKLLRTQLELRLDSEWVLPGPQGRPYSREQVGRVFRKAARAASLIRLGLRAQVRKWRNRRETVEKPSRPCSPHYMTDGFSAFTRG